MREINKICIDVKGGFFMFNLLAASGGTVTDMSKVVSDGLTTVASDMTGVISTIVPIALGIVGAVMVVTFGIKIFKRLTGK